MGFETTLDEKLDICAEIKAMDDEIRNYDGDETIIMYWLTYGVEDHISEWDDGEYFDYVDYYPEIRSIYEYCLGLMNESEI